MWELRLKPGSSTRAANSVNCGFTELRLSSYYVAESDLELLTPRPSLLSSGITDMHHHTQLFLEILFKLFFFTLFIVWNIHASMHVWRSEDDLDVLLCQPRTVRLWLSVLAAGISTF